MYSFLQDTKTTVLGNALATHQFQGSSRRNDPETTV
jgi:hypothetical protein